MQTPYRGRPTTPNPEPDAISTHPLDIFQRWVESWVDRALKVLIKKGFTPVKPTGTVYTPESSDQVSD